MLHLSNSLGKAERNYWHCTSSIFVYHPLTVICKLKYFKMQKSNAKVNEFSLCQNLCKSDLKRVTDDDEYLSHASRGSIY